MTLGQIAYEAAGYSEIPWKDLQVPECIRWEGIANSVRSGLDTQRIKSIVQNVVEENDFFRYKSIADKDVRRCWHLTCKECSAGHRAQFDWTQADPDLRWFHEIDGEFFACPASQIIIAFKLIDTAPHHEMGFNPGSYPVEYPDAYTVSGVPNSPQINPEPPRGLARLIQKVFPSRAMVNPHMVGRKQPDASDQSTEAKT